MKVQTREKFETLDYNYCLLQHFLTERCLPLGLGDSHVSGPLSLCIQLVMMYTTSNDGHDLFHRSIEQTWMVLAFSWPLVQKWMNNNNNLFNSL